MNHPRSSLVAACAALALLAQLTVSGPSAGRNPYTGAVQPQASVRNPYVGTHQPGSGTYNPLTGKRAGSPANPYTGRPLPQTASPNSWTGAGGTPPPHQPPPGWAMGKVPVTGKVGPGLAAFDQAILTVMDRHGIPGAALAIAKDGKLVYARGFGWSNLDTGEAAGPTTLFSLASCSKPITAMAVFKLLQEGKLKLDARAFDLLKHCLPGKEHPVDERIRKITIRQLLNHTGGWDRQKRGDPVNWAPMASRALQAPMPISAEQLIRYVLRVPLDFDPGTQSQYCNFGYIVLGEIVAKVSGKPYAEYVREDVLKPMGIRRSGITTDGRRYLPGEARRYLAGTVVQLPPFEMPWLQAAGGWSISPVDMARFLTAVDGSRGESFLTAATRASMLALPPPPLKANSDGTHVGLGWPKVKVTANGYSYAHDGLWHGMRTFMKRADDGINWILVLNGSMQPDLVDAKVIRAAVEEVQQQVEQFNNYPDVDYFKEY